MCFFLIFLSIFLSTFYLIMIFLLVFYVRLKIYHRSGAGGLIFSSQDIAFSAHLEKEKKTFFLNFSLTYFNFLLFNLIFVSRMLFYFRCQLPICKNLILFFGSFCFSKIGNYTALENFFIEFDFFYF